MKSSVRTTIEAQFRHVADEHEQHLSPLTDDLELLRSGLDSFCFAVIVVRLEETLGVDPFSASDDAVFPVTFGEFVKCYEDVLR